MKKLILAIIIFVATLTPLVAGDVIVNEYSLGGYTGGLSLYAQFAPTTTYSAYGQTFRTRFDGANVTSASFLMLRSGVIGAAANVSAYIYGVTGTYGSTAVANSTVYATSDPIACSTFGLTLDVYTFTFSTPYALIAGENYALVIGISTVGDMTSLKRLEVQYDNTGLMDGNYFGPTAGGWSPSSTNDLCFILYGDNGSPTTYIGGNTYISNYTTVLNSTVEATVTTGDVNVGGVTASFNNTAVTAGDVIAGDVTAGNIVGGTYNMTLTGDVISEGGGTNTELYVYSFIIFFLIVLNLLMYMYDKGYFLSSMVGILSIGLVAASFSPTINAYIVFSPWLQTMLLCIAIICMIGKIRTTRGS